MEKNCILNQSLTQSPRLFDAPGTKAWLGLWFGFGSRSGLGQKSADCECTFRNVQRTLQSAQIHELHPTEIKRCMYYMQQDVNDGKPVALLCM